MKKLALVALINIAIGAPAFASQTEIDLAVTSSDVAANEPVTFPELSTDQPVANLEVPSLPENAVVISLPAQVSDKDIVSKTLDVFHLAASKADWQTYFDQFSDDAVFLGTDANERWEKAVFQAYASKREGGWTYTPKERNINFTPDGNSAWFDEILDSKNYGTSRGTGLLVKTANGWKISQYHLTFPIPNELAEKVTTEIKNFEKSNATLDSFHQAASKADWKNYFNQMSDDAVFLGTDASERWEKATFQAYAETRKEGWTYTSKTRNINFTADGLTAWFDEILDSKNYGTSRGTGVLINTENGWKISQYHLTFPIPNALAVKFTDEFKAFEQKKRTAQN